MCAACKAIALCYDTKFTKSDSHHILQLTFDSFSKAANQHFTLNASYCEKHYLSGVLLQEVRPTELARYVHPVIISFATPGGSSH